MLTTHGVSAENRDRVEVLASWTDYEGRGKNASLAPRSMTRLRERFLEAKGGGTVEAERVDSADAWLQLHSRLKLNDGKVVEFRALYTPGRFLQVTAQSPDRPGTRETLRRAVESLVLIGPAEER